MQAILSILTATMLFSQAVLGLCCRNPQNCWGAEKQICCDAEKMENAAGETVTCCHHGDESQQPVSPCDCKVRCCGICTYVTTAKVQVDAPRAWFFTAVVPASCAEIGGQHCAAASFAELAQGTVDAGPPLQLHVLNQIWLI